MQRRYGCTPQTWWYEHPWLPLKKTKRKTGRLSARKKKKPKRRWQLWIAGADRDWQNYMVDGNSWMEHHELRAQRKSNRKQPLSLIGLGI